MLEHQNEHFVLDFLPIFTLCRFKIDVSCEASVTFQHISQNATPAGMGFPLKYEDFNMALYVGMAKYIVPGTTFGSCFLWHCFDDPECESN